MFNRIKRLFNKSSDDGDKDNQNTGVSTLVKVMPTKYKIIIIGGFFVFILFFMMIITTLMALGIIDITSTSSRSGLGYSSNTYLRQIGNDCKTIIVAGEAWPLEDYIIGVVSGEANNSGGMEALKAQAIAARTYAIVRTNNCQKEIKNSQADQVFNRNFTNNAREAVKATEGLVLTYDGKLFLSQYDAFYTGGDYSCNDTECSVTYKKEPGYEVHKVSVPISRRSQLIGGHGYGMSQVASYVMAENGSDFEEILKYFYSPGIEIQSLSGTTSYNSGLSAGTSGYMIRTSIPESDNSFYFSNDNLSYASGNTGQCTWYAYGRANEILFNAGSDLKWTCAVHAGQWYDCNIDNGANAFSYSDDVTKPKPGAIIVWEDVNGFGHVAVVEAVNDDGTLDYTESNIYSSKTNDNIYGWRYQSHISYTNTGLGTISNIWEGYNFIGYIYIVE